MKTYTNILTHTPTDTAPLAAAIDRFCLAVVAMLDACQHNAAFEAARQSARAVEAFCRAGFANHQRALKMDMLSHKYWRRLVLKELGGARALSRWRAAMKRCAARKEMEPKAEPVHSAWCKTPERMAEELRQKAHAQKCAKAAAAQTPYILRDPCKMDREGQFRLPPLPRLTGPRNADAAWTTPFDIAEYNYDATAVRWVSGYNAPILVWPEEFEVAELWDYERWFRERGVTSEDKAADDSPYIVIPAPVFDSQTLARSVAEPGPNNKVLFSPLGPGSASVFDKSNTNLAGMTKVGAVVCRKGHTLAQDMAYEDSG